MKTTSSQERLTTAFSNQVYSTLYDDVVEASWENTGPFGTEVLKEESIEKTLKKLLDSDDPLENIICYIQDVLLVEQGAAYENFISSQITEEYE